MKPEKGTMQTETHGKDGKKKGVPPPAELPQPESINPEAILKMYAAGETDLICILGPTASGKTRYAVNLARRLNSMLSDPALMSGITPAEGTRLSPETGAEIISADSRQVYRDMDIGTGKDLSEYGEIPVHLTDIADAGTKYNIFQYQHDFEAASPFSAAAPDCTSKQSPADIPCLMCPPTMNSAPGSKKRTLKPSSGNLPHSSHCTTPRTTTRAKGSSVPLK